MTKDEYNQEPVYYCTRCLSLAQTSLLGQCYCENCGSTESASATIYEWENKYMNRYNHKYLEENGRDQ